MFSTKRSRRIQHLPVAGCRATERTDQGATFKHEACSSRSARRSCHVPEAVSLRTGRERHYEIDARPLREIQLAWLDSFAPLWEQSLERLKHEAEKER